MRLWYRILASVSQREVAPKIAAPVEAAGALFEGTRELLAYLGALVARNCQREVLVVWVLLFKMVFKVVLKPVKSM